MIKNMLHITRNSNFLKTKNSQNYLQKLSQQQQQNLVHTKNFTKNIVFQFSKKPSKPSNNNAGLKQLLLLVKPEWKMFIGASILSAISAGFLMYIPKVIPEFGKLYANIKEPVLETDSEEEKTRKKEFNKSVDQKYIDFIKLWGCLCLFQGVFTMGRRYLAADLGNRIQFRLRNMLYTNLIFRDAQFFARKNISTANFVHKLSNDISNIGSSLSMDLFFGFRSLFMIGGGTFYMVTYSPDLIFPCFIILSGLTLSTKFIGGYQRKYKLEETQKLTKTSELAHERLGNIKLIKVSNTEVQEKYLYFKVVTDFYNKSRQVSYYTALNFGILESFGFTSLIGIITYGSYLVSIGISHPDMVSSAIYALYVGMGFRSLLNSYTELSKTAGLYDGIQELVGDVQQNKLYNNPDLVNKRIQLIQEQQEKLSIRGEQKIDLENIDPPTISIKNVTFKYDEYGKKRSLFQNLNLEIPKGKIIAIVGPSGCGKTTLLSLLTRLYQPEDGQILINGENLQKFDKNWVQKNISYVTQEPILLQGTIKENLEYGNHGFDISFENMQNACQIANADAFINDLPNKYDEILMERGQNLSGGQRQRIILARALIKNPKILIMDEGTANLDQESEKAIIRDLKQMCKNRTCILITHKIENYMEIIDDIITMEKPQQEEEEDIVAEEKLTKLNQESQNEKK